VCAFGWYVVSQVGIVALGLCWSTTVGVGDSQVYPAYVCMKENSGCVLIPIWGILGGTYVWLGLCHPRGHRCERGPFRVADKAGVGDLQNTRPVCWFLVAGVFITVVLGTV